MDRSIPKLHEEIVGRLVLFEAHLPRDLDPPALSRSTLPFKALDYRETLIWRVTEIGQSALEALDKQRLASGLLLTRAAVETTAALWYLSQKVKLAVKNNEPGDIDTYLMKLSLGHRGKGGFPEAISVLTFVDHVEREVEGFRRQYDELSEYAHPNYLGTTGLYSQRNAEEFTVSYGPNPRATGAAITIGIVNLSVALMVFEHTYEKLGDLIPAFVRVCDKSLK